MNQEYIKIEKKNYIVTDENGIAYKRTVPSPELFECENDNEIVDNEIKSLEAEKDKITKDMKDKNIRQLLFGMPILALWNVVIFTQSLPSFLNPSTGVLLKVFFGGVYTAFIIGDALLISDNVFSNLETRERKQKINKSLAFAKSVKKKCERELEKYKLRSVSGIKDTAKKDKKVSLKEENDYKAYKLRERLTQFYDPEYYESSHVLKRTK